MNEEDNPYNPSAGARPPALAGRGDIIRRAEIAIKRTKAGKPPKGLILLGLRGVGKTVLLNEFDQIAEKCGCHPILFEADDQRSLAEQLTPQLHKLLLQLNRIALVGHSLTRAFGLLQGFASIFKVKYGDAQIGVAEPVTGDLNLDLTEVLSAVAEAAAARKTAAVILIDEIHTLKPADLGALMMALHRISQRQLPLLLLGGGLPQLARLAGDAKSYAERLFDYPAVERLDQAGATEALVMPARGLGVEYEAAAIAHILRETSGYPFFLQLWGSHAWAVAPASPITLAHARAATKRALKHLDEGIFNSRYERLTERQRQYARALAEFGDEPAASGDIAALMGLGVNEAAPMRDELIKKGMAYSPERGMVAFTVPLFARYMKRRMPDFQPADRATALSGKRKPPHRAK